MIDKNKSSGDEERASNQVARQNEKQKKQENGCATNDSKHLWHRISMRIFPLNSKRYFLMQLCAKLVSNPRLMLRVINLRRIRNFFLVYKQEGMKGVLYHYHEVEEVEKKDFYQLTDNQLEIHDIPLKKAKEFKQVTDYEQLLFDKYVEPQVSIIIPTYNQFDYTYNCLLSIKEHTNAIKYEILLADDGSEDFTQKIEEIIKGIRVIRNNQLRFLRNCNESAIYAKGNYLVFLNNDTQVQENWLAPLVELMDEDSSVGLVGSKLVYPDGRLQEAGGIIWKDASAANYGNGQSPMNPEFNYVKDVDFVTGASIMVRKKIWEEIGGFDERFVPAYYEDVDLAFEVRKRGYKVIYQPLSIVVHYEGISNGTDLNSGQKAYQIVNQKKFYSKWSGTLERQHFEKGQNMYLAKDRGRFSKQLLYIDQYVPFYDKDAGGKSAYMYLALFVKLGFKVTFIGDDFTKHEPYTTKLNQQGIEVLYGNYYRNNIQEWLKENLEFFDYVYMERPQVAKRYIDLIQKYSQAKTIYFACDLHHIREYREYQLTHERAKLKSSKRWKKIEYELFAKADVGHVVGTYEQKIMQNEFPNKPIRNIPIYIYENMRDNANQDFEKRKDILFVGGFGHAPNIDAVLWFAEKVFPKILTKYPNMKWYIVGGSVPDVISNLSDNHVIVKGYLSDEDLQELYDQCRMAVVPLRVGAGVKGKVVEAAYFQIPLVTTTIGAEGLDDKIGNMVIEDNSNKMADVINNLYENYETLYKMSAAGEVFIQRYFSLKEAQRVIELDIEK